MACFDEIFLSARELSDSAERSAYLRDACASDADLLENVETMLRDATGADAFFDGVDSERFRAMTGSPTEVPGMVIGRYKLLERIGEGGMGVVYMAEQEKPVHRRVALKIIKLGLDSQQVVARFEAERQALALMDHPNIARVLDGGATDTGRPYFVMELVHGVPITDFCHKNGLSTRERLKLFIPVCEAIQSAHQKGIIHRDLKPGNVLVGPGLDGAGVPKVIDFGVAKAIHQKLTEKTLVTSYTTMIGTPAYMSPEQAEMSGLDADTRSDIYSLGVLLYELLTGSTPFDTYELAQSGLDQMRKIIREREPVRPSTRLRQTVSLNVARSQFSTLSAHFSTDLDWIVMKCLEKDRTRRYETAIGLAADLQRHLSHEPVVARPPSAVYKFQKTFRRHKLACGAGVAVLLALLLGLGISIWQYAGKSRAEREQHRLRQQAESRAREAGEAHAQASQQRDLARDRLFESYVREVRLIRKARQIGYRGEAFARLKDTLALETAHADPSVLRNEAVACLGDWVGLDPIDIEIPGRVASATLTADGSSVAIGTWDRRVSLREAQTGQEAAVFQIAGVPFSLAFDLKGTALFAFVVDHLTPRGQRPTSVHLEKWSLRGDDSWRLEWSRPKPGTIGCCDTARGPVSLVLGPDDAYLAVEEPDTDTEIARIPLESRMPWLPIAALSADRGQLALLSRDGQSGLDVQLEVWDLDSNQRLARVRPHRGAGWGLGYGWGGGTLAVTYDNTLMVHDTVQFGTSINLGGAFEGTYGGAVGGSADGLLAVPSVQELAVRLIEVHSGGEVAYLKLPGSPDSSHFSADGSVLLLTHNLGARILHLKLDQEKLLLQAHQGGVPCAEFSPDGKELVSTGKDRTLRIWDLTRSGGSRVLARLPAPGQTLTYTPDGQYLVCGYYNTGELSIWSVPSGRLAAEVRSDGVHTGTTWSCAISPNGQLLAAIGSGLRVWDLPRLLQSSESPGATSQPFISSTNGASGLFFDAAGKSLLYQVARNESQGEIYGQSVEPTAQPSLIATNVESNYAQSQCLLPKRGEVAYVTRDREITILDSATSKVLRSFPTRQPGDDSGWFIANLRASPDETRFALVTPSGLGVEIRDVITGEVLYALPEETAAIWWLAWHPDSQHLAITRANGEIAIWNLSEVDTQLARLGLKP